MRRRPTMMIAALTVVVAACAPADGATPSSATAPHLPREVAAAAFEYSYEAGDHHDYAFDLQQNLDMMVEVEGGKSLLGEDPPGDINVTTSVAGTVSYDITDGPAPGTRQISISGVFDELSVTGSIDGEPVEEEMIEEGTVPDLVQVPDLTIVIDEYGHLVSVAGEEVSEDLAFFGDPIGELDDFTSGGLAGHFGPEFPDEPLKVGDTWSLTQSEDLEEFNTVMSVESNYEVTGTEFLNGSPVAVIEFTTRTSEVVLDLGQMFQALFEAFGGLESGMADEPAAGDLPQIEFVITVDPSTAVGSVWFDQEAGLVARFSQNTATVITMLMDFVDASEAVRTEVKMDLIMQLTAELVDEPSA